jgi:plasmid stabilization system protein ParE
MARVIWLPEALRHLNAIRTYIEQFDIHAADRLTRRLLSAGDGLASFPQKGRPGRDGSRELATVPPYVIRYDFDGQIVHILGIRHGRQLPAEE